ncbi:MAG: hypothetical protein ABIF10_02440 [Candidatus Woesearchaeota archaeon]
MHKLIGLFIVLLLAGCSTQPAVQQECRTAADCVPAECCHPTSCTTAMERPDCAAIACTQECAPDTMDCGRGYCDCVNGKCTAVAQKGESGQ